MLLSVWFVIPTHPLSCVAPEKKKVIHVLARDYNSGGSLLLTLLHF